MMSDVVFPGIPGDAPDDVATTQPPAAVANVNEPTGTPMDLAGSDLPVDLTDPMAAGLAAFFEHQAAFKHPTPGLESASAAPTSVEGSTDDPGSTPVPPTEPSTVTPDPAAPASPEVPDPESSTVPPTPDAPTSQSPTAAATVPPGEPPITPDPATSPQATPPVPPQSWVPAGHVLVGEVPIPEAQIPDLVRVYNWARSMPPELAQAIRDLESGNFILTPRSAPPQSQYSPPASGSGAPPSPYSSGAGAEQPPFDPSQSLDPQLAAQVQWLAQQQAALMAQQQAQVAQQQAQQRATFEAQIDSAKTTFATDPSRNLSAPEMHYLTDRVAQMQMFPGLLRQHNNDISAAMVAALDAAYWADPEFRNRHNGQQVQSQVDQTMLANQALQQKRQRAASLAGTSAPISHTPPAAAPLTRDTATSGMVSAIAEALGASSNNGNTN